MNFTPIDEMSVRHLFSSQYAQEELRLSYIGPILNSSGKIETSPDCMILDMRSHPFKSLRCEFKFVPSGKEDFSQNGKFDIAIMWSIPQSLSKQQLKDELFKQNGCTELVVLDERKAFKDLPVYTIESTSRLSDIGIVRQLALNRKYPSVFALYIAARLYPDKFQMSNMVTFLTQRFPSVKKMLKQGRSNVVCAFIQTNPPLLTKMHGNFFRWTSEIDNISAANELRELITSNFGESPPSRDDVELLRI